MRVYYKTNYLHMKSIFNITKLGFLLTMTLVVFQTLAGNEDRVGSAGASQLLVNPWSRSVALGDANLSYANGLEATYTNIAGLAYTDKTQIKFSYTNWLGNAGIPYIGAGFAQKIGESSAIAVSVQSMSFGSIARTTEDNPDGNIGTYAPSYNTVNLGYAKLFTHSISGGINLKLLSESISNINSFGVALDAGIRYVTGDKDKFKMGITLKNVGPTIKQEGDGLSTQINYQKNGNNATLEQRSQSYELPSLLAIGVSYDFLLGNDSKFTPSFAFTANSFSKDQFRVGLDYGLVKSWAALNVRVGYVYEDGIFDDALRTNSLTGLTAGFSFDALYGKNKSAIGFEYAIRTTGPFGFIHTFGTTINIK